MILVATIPGCIIMFENNYNDHNYYVQYWTIPYHYVCTFYHLQKFGHITAIELEWYYFINSKSATKTSKDD